MLVADAFSLLLLIQRSFFQQTHRRDSQQEVFREHHNYVGAKPSQEMD